MKEKLQFTLRECIYLALNPGLTMTVSDVTKLASRLRAEQVKLQSISSLLHRLAAAGTIERIEGFGPLGGSGYRKITCLGPKQ